MVHRLVKLGLVIFCAAATASGASATGPQTFSTHCSICHQPSGAGLPGQFPRLTGRVSEIAATPEGRRYLAMVILYGMYGPISVDGTPIRGLMPGMGTLKDQDVADVLNHALSLKKVGKPASFTAAEIAAVRASGKKTAAEVAAERGKLAAKGLIPK